MMLCGCLRDRIQPWLRDYVRLQSLAVFLIYTQIGCALIGSLGALYNGVLLINLAIALFALVAIESNSQSLGRTYAVLLFCAILLDVSWFILFTQEIWSISAETYGTFFIFSVKLTMAMEMIGFFVRLSSSLLWFQIYRLGASIVDTSLPRETDPDLRNSFLNPPTPAIARQCSGAEEILGGSIYDPSYYTSLFEEGQTNVGSPKATQVNHYTAGKNGSPSADEASQIKSPISRSLHSIDEEKGLKQPGMSSI
uniref:Transmembrane protein n=1 Tax=Noccaea caerulescens TaxID=107243 RepID=A0A1J3HAH7_NOCCA